MIDGQLRTNKVTSPEVLDAFSELQREDFAPDSLRESAYVDEDIDLGNGRVLMEPMIAARLLQDAQIKSGSKVLVIGAGNGSLVGLLVSMGADVTAMEPVSALCDAGRQALPNAIWLNESFDALPNGKFDRILTGGAISAIPSSWVGSLAQDGLIIALIGGQAGNDGRAVIARAVDGELSSHTLFNAATPLLPEFAAEARFEF